MNFKESQTIELKEIWRDEYLKIAQTRSMQLRNLKRVKVE